MLLNSLRNSLRFVWRNTPNAISLARLAAAPILLETVLWRRPEFFKWLLLACLLSDIVDGLLARIFRLRSPLGATLDSTADLLVTIMMIAGVCVFQGQFVRAHIWEISAALALYILEIIAAIWRYGRISSFHTLLNRIAAYGQGIFVMSLFLWGYKGWVFHPVIALTIAAVAEEFLLLWVLPKSRVDVRGLYWVLSKREAGSK